jgi:hypothetical protein
MRRSRLRMVWSQMLIGRVLRAANGQDALMTCWMNSCTLVMTICPSGPGSLSDMLEDSVGLIRLAGAQNREYQGADGTEAEEKKLGNELVFDHVGVDVGLLSPSP